MSLTRLPARLCFGTAGRERVPKSQACAAGWPGVGGVPLSETPTLTRRRPSGLGLGMLAETFAGGRHP